MARTFKRKPVVWFIDGPARGVVTASLAADAQVTIADVPLDHPGSGEDYGPGAIVGLRVRMYVSAAAALLGQPKIVVLVEPQGLAVPTVNTAATLKQNEKYVWGVFSMSEQPGSSSNRWHIEIAPRTARRFEPGDRLVLVLVNHGATAFAAGAAEGYVIDAYLRED